MMGFVAHWVVTFLAALVVSNLLRFVVFPSWGNAALFALLLGLLNAFVRPVLALLTLPLTILTLGLFSLLLNLLMFWLAVRWAGGSIEGGLLGLIVAALAVSLVSALIGAVLGVR